MEPKNSIVSEILKEIFHNSDYDLLKQYVIEILLSKQSMNIYNYIKMLLNDSKNLTYLDYKECLVLHEHYKNDIWRMLYFLGKQKEMTPLEYLIDVYNAHKLIYDTLEFHFVIGAVGYIETLKQIYKEINKKLNIQEENNES